MRIGSEPGQGGNRPGEDERGRVGSRFGMAQAPQAVVIDDWRIVFVQWSEGARVGLGEGDNREVVAFGNMHIGQARTGHPSRQWTRWTRRPGFATQAALSRTLPINVCAECSPVHVNAQMPVELRWLEDSGAKRLDCHIASLPPGVQRPEVSPGPQSSVVDRNPCPIRESVSRPNGFLSLRASSRDTAALPPLACGSLRNDIQPTSSDAVGCAA